MVGAALVIALEWRLPHRLASHPDPATVANDLAYMTRVALSVAQAAGDRLIAQEGAFGTHLLQHDVCTPPLLFGAGGTLDYQSGEPGWGLDCAPDPGCLGD